MEQKRTYGVNQVAQAAGVSVRTLHHYDQIGILVPKRRSRSGYRVYDEQDLLRLQQILIGRELGLSLEVIRRSFDDPNYDRKQTLLHQKQQLLQRAEQTGRMIRAVDAALELIEQDSGGTMDIQQIFDGFDHSQYESEVTERWGNTEAYRESTRRTKGYTAQHWQQIKAEQSTIYADAVAALRAGRAPESVEAMDIAERHRLSMDRWFFPCSYAMHQCLADLYQADQRFAENIDRYEAGLTDYLVAAIRANARRGAP